LEVMTRERAAIHRSPGESRADARAASAWPAVCGSTARVVFVGEEAPEIGPEISGDFPQVLAALVERAESSRW